MKNVVIIGNGISGITAARNLRKSDSDVRITVISGETTHFFSRTALMYVYMGHMKFEHTKPYEDHFWEKNRIELLQKWVRTVDTRTKTLYFSDGERMNYGSLILATGSKPNKFGWPGQDLRGVQGLYSYQDLLQLEENTHPPFTPAEKQRVKRAVLVGGGLIGVELAEMLLTRNIEVTFLVRESGFWGNVLTEDEGALIAKEMEHHGVDLRLNTELEEILGDGEGKVEKVITKGGELIECQLVGLTAGVSPNIEFLQDSDIKTDRGILVDRKLKTNVEDVYAIGDCAQFRNPPSGRRPIEQVWYTGRMMGEVVAENISGRPSEYNPGPWFNSAKFFDVEYQTYGLVSASPEENEEHFFWKHEDGRKWLTIAYDRESLDFIGINTFGIRMRHELFDRWLREQRSVGYVLEHLPDANFDPEFYRNFEKEIIQAFNQHSGLKLKAKKKSWKRILKLS